ncbi:putative disease resistance protein At3g14460 [Lactuca sativa]|uniref:putative disease resistance protein At3g14460 n=1 Tax=Lactuca sativa TaxID=4236 RepID=UPI000CBE281D|nr:putative disease resistance protein At3g14460 [Lactuca sativa]
MAEIIVSAFFSVFFEKLASEAIKKIARAKGIDSQLRKLKRSLIQIRALLNDASQKEISDEAVKEWLNGLQHLAYDIDDLLDDLATEGMHRELTDEFGASTSLVRKIIPTCCTDFPLSSRMSSKLDAITTKLQELVEEKENLGLSVKDESPKHMNRRLETSLVDASSIVGRKDEKDALIHKLYEPCDRNYSIVPIVGMGGVGKTTLARLLYDEMQGKAHFELNAWVCVSDEFDIFNITKVIFQAIGGGNQEFKDLNLLQVALKEKISKKRFLLVLDDVWSESYTDWEILERPFLAGAPGSKIIITTRKLSLLTQLGYNQPYTLSVLSHENAVSLFCQHAFGENNFDSHPSLKPHGEGIVEKCDGLPLALIALGRLLRTKSDEEEWKELLNSEIWRLGNRDKIIPALRLSYHDLPANLKLLFAYCSLFPKDYMFDMEELILLWMAEGFLHQSSTGKSMERMGVECFEDLLSRSFFQHAPNDESFFVMHDLINDLAMSVAGEFFSRLDIEMKKEVGKEDSRKYRHMSFVCETFMVYTKFKAFKGANSLRTLLALSVGMINSWQTFYLSNKVLDNLLEELPLLRVLSLSNLSIREVPEFVGNLKHLRYLNLSQTKITHLPDNIGNLYNLQALIVSGCSYLKKLPESFSKLKNLRHFDMRDTPLLKKMPLGIGELKSLRTLSKIIIEGDSGFSITELKDLKDLQGKISFKGLDKVQNPMHAQEVNLSHRRLSELGVEWSDVFDNSRMETVEQEVLNVMKPHNDNLKRLKIVSYGGTEFPSWVGDPSFHRLAKVTLNGCKKCTSLPLLGQLLFLKELYIGGMDAVKVVGSELLGTTGLGFPSLEILCFRDMKGWEVWSTNNNGVLVDTAFPCLQDLSIWNCPNLVRVSIEALPSLRVLRISGCGHEVLGSLVRVASSVTKLDIDKISGLNDQVWGGVIEHLGAVEELCILRCNEIRYLWESEAEASKVLVNLSRLHVGSCSNMVSLGEKEEDNCGSNLTSLTSLTFMDCDSLEHCSCPHSLKSLTIWNCNKLLEKELVGARKKPLINSNILMLESVDIIDWPNLKSITDLSSFNHLRNLRIKNCPNMESFPDHELPKLNVLTHLTILNCQSMDASFPIGLWPPKLCWLEIGGLKKPISKWGPQNFPTSLVNLLLVGGGSEDVSNISQLSHLLPSSLTSLYIEEFEKVESVSKGLQHLTSLQHLLIRNCPKTRDLPEMLLPSLLSLEIRGCPNLKERSSKRGSYWPLVSRIPCIRIY